MLKIMRRLAVLTICTSVLTFASLASAQPTTRVKLETMGLEVELPAGWGIDPNPGEWRIGTDVLSPGGAMWPTVEVMHGFGTCEKLLEHWRRNKPLEPRLSIIPEAYHPMVVYDEKHPTAVNYVHTCVGAPPEPLHVRLRFVPGDNNAGVTAVLAAIARAYENRPGKPSLDTQPPPLPAREQRLPASGLVVKVPGRWKIYQERVRDEPVDLLVGGGESIIISRFAKNNCAFLIKAYEDQNRAPASPLPDFAPRSFYGSAVVQNTSSGLRYTFCRNLGNGGSYLIMATVAMADRASPDLVDTLHSIARAIDDVAPASSTTPTVATLASRTHLSGSGLTVLLPTGWSAERAERSDIAGDSIIGPREIVLVVRIGNAGCRAYLDSYTRTSQGTTRPLPAFAPASAYPEAVLTRSRGMDVYGMCFSKPPGVYVLEVHVPAGATGSSELASILKSIGEAIQPPAATTSSPLSGSNSAGNIGWKLDVIPSYPRKVDQFAFEVRGAMLSPSNDAMSGGYGVAAGLSRLVLGRPGEPMKMASELVAVAGYASQAGVTADVRAGVGAALPVGSNSRIGLLVGGGLDGIGIGEDEGDPSKLVLPFDTYYYATAALRTWIGHDKALQLSGSYRSRGNTTEYLGEARVFVAKKRPLSLHAFYQDVELARVIGGGLAFGL